MNIYGLWFNAVILPCLSNKLIRLSGFVLPWNPFWDSEIEVRSSSKLEGVYQCGKCGISPMGFGWHHPRKRWATQWWMDQDVNHSHGSSLVGSLRLPPAFYAWCFRSLILATEWVNKMMPNGTHPKPWQTQRLGSLPAQRKKKQLGVSIL